MSVQQLVEANTIEHIKVSLCGETPGDHWIPLTKENNWESVSKPWSHLDTFIYLSSPGQTHLTNSTMQIRQICYKSPYCTRNGHIFRSWAHFCFKMVPRGDMGPVHYGICATPQLGARFVVCCGLPGLLAISKQPWRIWLSYSYKSPSN